MKHITDERRAAMLEDRATLLAWAKFFGLIVAGWLLGLVLVEGAAWLANTLFAWSKT